MKCVAVIPVRMGSSRLPGKVMTPILGKPLLGYLLDRIGRCELVDEIVVATSTGKDNDIIATYCRQRNIEVFRGSESDVLDRVVQALIWRKAEIGVLVFGDCPLIDPEIITQTVSHFLSKGELDFVSNDLSTTWPPGMEVEVFKVAALEDSASRCDDAGIREHGTLYMRQNPNLYQLHNLEAPLRYRRPDLSLEVDVAEDLDVIKTILTVFGGRSDMTLSEIISYLERHPSLAARNRDVTRRWRQYRNDTSEIKKDSRLI